MDGKLLQPPEIKRVVSPFLKFCLCLVAFFLWIVGAVFVAVAAYMITQDENLGHASGYAITPPALLATVGCIIFVVSTLGLLGIVRENLRLLRLYKYFLLLVLLMGLCSALFGYAFWPEVKKIIDHKIRLAIKHYRDDNHNGKDLKAMIDKIQRHLKCCGSLSIHDWDSNAYYECRKKGSYRSCGVPWSCCLPKHERNRQCGYRIRKNTHKRKGKPLSADIYTVGCLDRAFDYLEEQLRLLGGIALASTAPFFLSIYLIDKFIKQIRRQIDVFNDSSSGSWNGDTTSSSLSTSSEP